MAKGILYDPDALAAEGLISTEPVLIKKGDGVVTTEGAGTNVIVQGDSTVPVYIGGTYAGYKVKNIDAQKGIEVIVDDSGNTKWLPAGVNERLVEHIDADGNLNLLSAVKAGITDPVDYAAYQVTTDQIAAAEKLAPYLTDAGTLYTQRALDDGISEETIRLFVSDFVAADKPTDTLAVDTDKLYSSVSEKIQPYISNGSVDVVSAVASGLTSVSDYDGVDGITQQDLDALKTLVAYRNDDGTFDLNKAITEGVEYATIKEVFDIPEDTYQAIKEGREGGSNQSAAPAYEKAKNYITDGKIDVVKAIQGGLTAEELAAIGVTDDVYRQAQDSITKQERYGQYISGTSFDVLKAVQDGVSDQELADLGIPDSTIAQSKLIAKYSTDTGFDTTAALADGVTNEELIALGLADNDIQRAADLKTLQDAGVDIQNFTVTDAISKGASREVLSRLGVLDQDLDAAEKYLKTTQFYNADGTATIADAISKGATDADLKDMGFAAEDIAAQHAYDQAMAELTEGGYLNGSDLDLDKLYKNDKLDLVKAVNSDVTDAYIAELKQNYKDFYENNAQVGQYYITKADLQAMTDTWAQLRLNADQRKDLLAAVGDGDLEAYNTKIQKYAQDKFDALYVTGSDGTVTDYNYSAVQDLIKKGQLTNTLKAIGVEDTSAWLSDYNDSKYLHDYVQAKNTAKNREGTLDDYIMEAGQNVLDRVNRLYGTDYQHGKYADLYNSGELSKLDNSTGVGLVGGTGKNGSTSIGQWFMDHPDYSFAEYIQYTIDRGQSALTNAVTDAAKTKIVASVTDTVNKILANFYTTKLLEKYNVGTGITAAKNKLIEVQQGIGTTIDKYFQSEAARTALKTPTEIIVNDVVLDPLILITSAAESSYKAGTGDVVGGVQGYASLGLALVTYPMTIPNTIKQSPSQGIAEVVSLVVPSEALLKPLTKAVKAGTVSKIASIHEKLQVRDAKLADIGKTNYSVGLAGEKRVKTATIPVVDGKFTEVNVRGFRDEDFGKITNGGFIPDGQGDRIGYSRYVDENGHVTYLLNAENRTKWDTAANRLVWDALQDFTHNAALLNDGKVPTTSVVYGNLKLTSSDGKINMATVQGNKVVHFQLSENISPVNYSNNYKVTATGVQVTKTGKDAPLMVVDIVDSKRYTTYPDGSLDKRSSGNLTQIKDKSKLSTAAEIKERVKEYARTDAEIAKIILDPRGTKSLLKDIKKVIQDNRTRTREENYHAMMQLLYALAVMDPKDTAKVLKWAKRPSLKKLIDNGEYAKFVEIVGLDKVDPFPGARTERAARLIEKTDDQGKTYLDIRMDDVEYRTEVNEKSKKMAQSFLEKIREDEAKLQKVARDKYESTLKRKKAIMNATIPVVLTARLLTTIPDLTDAKIVTGPRIELVQDVTGKAQTKVTDTEVKVAAETKTDKEKVQAKTEKVSPKLNESKLSDMETKAQEGSKVNKISQQKAIKAVNQAANKAVNVSETLETTYDASAPEVTTVNTGTLQTAQKTAVKQATENTKVNVTATKADVNTETNIQVDAETKVNNVIQDEVTAKVAEDTKVDTEIKADTSLKAPQQYEATLNIQQADLIKQTMPASKTERIGKVDKFGRILKGNLKAPKIQTGTGAGKAAKGKEKAGAVVTAWRQGSLKIKGRTRPVWIVIRKQGSKLVKSYEYKTPEGAPVTKGKPWQTVFHKGKKLKSFKVKVGFNRVTVDLTKTGKDKLKYVKERDAYRYKLPSQRQLSSGRR